ncbi:MAG TPA: DMT family transporter [Candidatus Limnocylindrales bacterium]|nr:DMT family transporter [Candidatus Limnocylindrales bacterium]
MLAILGGFGAALCWATSSMASARSARLIGSWATLGWVMLIGTVIAVPATILGGAGADLTPTALQLLAISGVGNIVGLLLAYTAFQGGKVAVIAPILSTEGAMGAVISIVFGEQVGLTAAVVLTAIAVGIVLASAGGTDEALAAEPGGLALDHGALPAADPAEGPGHPDRKATLVALGAVVFFGINLYASARIGATLPIVWAVLPARLGGFVFVALPLLATRRLRLTREAVPFVIVVALTELVGTAVYAFGARDGIAVAAVTSSQFGAIAAVVSVVAFGERLRRIQVAGVVVIAAGVALLAALQAS